jgi:hypothetical protein
MTRGHARAIEDRLLLSVDVDLEHRRRSAQPADRIERSRMNQTTLRDRRAERADI